jgi:hypothetical protein
MFIGNVKSNNFNFNKLQGVPPWSFFVLFNLCLLKTFINITKH